MKAVLADGCVLYLGNDEATVNFLMGGAKNDSSDVEVREVYTLEDLASYFEEEEEDPVADSLDRLLQRLEELDVDEIADRLIEKGEKAVAEVRSLGVRGMEAVGRGFVALGELLNKAAEEEDD